MRKRPFVKITAEQALLEMKKSWLHHYGYSEELENWQLKDGDRDFFESFDSYVKEILEK